VINLSLDGTRDCEPWWIEDWTDTGVAYLRDAIDYAFSRGVVVVAAAGNTGSNRQAVAGRLSARALGGEHNFNGCQGIGLDLRQLGAGFGTPALPSCPPRCQAARSASSACRARTHVARAHRWRPRTSAGWPLWCRLAAPCSILRR